MKTKTLLLTTLLALAGSASLLAQSNVYSLNVVGYVNVPLTAHKFSMIANPLKNGDNKLNTILATNIPEDTLIYKFQNGAYLPPASFITDFGWDQNFALNPGEGAFVLSPVTTNLTFVGEVVLSSTNPIPVGFSMISSVVPQSTNVTALALPAGEDDLIYQYNPVAGAYYPPASYIADFGWDSASTNGPTLAVGEAVFYKRASKNGATTWVRNFTIQ